MSEGSFDASSKTTEELLKKKSMNMLIMYHLIYELHWRPKDVFEMEPWELGMMWALMDYHHKQQEKD